MVGVPGPSAVVAAVVVSGVVQGEWMFRGFLSNRDGERRRQVEGLWEKEESVVLYEAPHRILNLVELFEKTEREKGTERSVVFVRELTKKYEQVLRFDNAKEAHEWFYPSKNNNNNGNLQQQQPVVRGEFTVVLGPLKKEAKQEDQFLVNRVDSRNLLRQLVDAGISPSTAAKSVASALDLPRKPLYSFALTLEKEDSSNN